MMKNILNPLSGKRLFLIILLANFTCIVHAQTYREGIDKLSNNLLQRIKETDKKRIAVYNFNNLKRETSKLGAFLADKLSVSLASSGAELEIIDRSRIDDLIRENKLAIKGYIDPEAAKSLGKLAGIDLLITGVITPIGESFDISVKILDIETATVRGGDDIAISKTTDLEEMNKEIINYPNSNGVSTSTTSPNRTNPPGIGGYEVKYDPAPDCEGEKTGGIVFYNNSSKPLYSIYIQGKSTVYTIPVGGSYFYNKVDVGHRNIVIKGYLSSKRIDCSDQVYIPQCKVIRFEVTEEYFKRFVND